MGMSTKVQQKRNFCGMFGARAIDFSNPGIFLLQINLDGSILKTELVTHSDGRVKTFPRPKLRLQFLHFLE